MKHKNLLSMKDFDTLHKAKKITNRTGTGIDVLNEMKITDGQDKIISGHFNYDRSKSNIEFEAGNDTGETFNGDFIVNIFNKGTYKFTNGNLVKKIH